MISRGTSSSQEWLCHIWSVTAGDISVLYLFLMFSRTKSTVVPWQILSVCIYWLSKLRTFSDFAASNDARFCPSFGCSIVWCKYLLNFSYFYTVSVARFEVIAAVSSSGLWRHFYFQILTWHFGGACCLHVPGLSGDLCNFVGLFANRLRVMSRKTYLYSFSRKHCRCSLRPKNNAVFQENIRPFLRLWPSIND